MGEIKMKKMFVSLVIMLAFAHTFAMAAESKNAAQSKPQYKKVTGEVVSVSPTTIVIKGRSAELTLAVTDKTDTIGASKVKAGDRAAVNYKVEKTGKTATRIKVLSPAGGATAVPASAASSQKQN